MGTGIPVYTVEPFISYEAGQAIQASFGIFISGVTYVVLAVNNSVYHGKFDVIFVVFNSDCCPWKMITVKILLL